MKKARLSLVSCVLWLICALIWGVDVVLDLIQKPVGEPPELLFWLHLFTFAVGLICAIVYFFLSRSARHKAQLAREEEIAAKAAAEALANARSAAAQESAAMQGAAVQQAAAEQQSAAVQD